MKLPQVTPAALSMSPIVAVPMVTWLRVEFEQTSRIGSASPITVSELSPPKTSSAVPFLVAVTALVWPEIRLITPGVEGPNVVPYELSLIAKN